MLAHEPADSAIFFLVSRFSKRQDEEETSLSFSLSTKSEFQRDACPVGEQEITTKCNDNPLRYRAGRRARSTAERPQVASGPEEMS